MLLAVCAIVYGLFLGTPGFASSEAHRVVPGWTMAQSGDWLRLEMFGTPYLRKPPGAPWAIGAAGAILGYSEWTARLPSALGASLGVLITLGFATRWFGRRAGLAAALAQALTPVMWAGAGWGRSAEIEMLCVLGAQAAALGVMHALVFIPACERRTPGACLRVDRAAALVAIVLGTFLTVIMKGAAAAPVLAAAGLAGLLFGRPRVCDPSPHAGRLRSGLVATAAAALLGGGLAVGLWWRVWTHSHGPGAVTEEGSFLWTRPVGVLTLIPSAWAAALPAGLALLMPIVARRSRGTNGDDRGGCASAVCSALTVAWPLALVIYAVVGVGNPRYALPAIGLLFPVAGFWFAQVWTVGTTRRPLRSSDRLGRALSLGHPAVWPAVLLPGAIISAYLYTHREQAHVTREVGARLAEITAERSDAAARVPAVIVADGVVEARPDVLLYAVRASASDSTRLLDAPVRGRWLKPPMPGHTDFAQGRAVFLLLRDDEPTPPALSGVPPLETFRFGKYRAAVWPAPAAP